MDDDYDPRQETLSYHLNELKWLYEKHIISPLLRGLTVIVRWLTIWIQQRKREGKSDA